MGDAKHFQNSSIAPITRHVVGKVEKSKMGKEKGQLSSHAIEEVGAAVAAAELLGDDVLRRGGVNPAVLALEHLGPREVLQEQHPHRPSSHAANSNRSGKRQEIPFPGPKSAIEQRETAWPLDPVKSRIGRMGGGCLARSPWMWGGIGPAAVDSGGGFGWGEEWGWESLGDEQMALSWRWFLSFW